MMAMDNLDSVFHPPPYVEQYAASFYEQASQICHEHGSTFFIHACGQQRANLRLISSLGVDGLEGVASPPLGDGELDEACAMIRTEIDSMPTELDEVTRRVMQLEIEEAALKKEKDKASKEHLEALRALGYPEE